MKRINSELSIREAKRPKVEHPEPEHGERLSFLANLEWRNKNHVERTRGKFLCDSGATGPILNRKYVEKFGIPQIKCVKPITLKSADGQIMTSADYAYSPLMLMIMGKHTEELSFEISELEDEFLGYLPMSWLRKHNPGIDWASGKYHWRSEYCRTHCLPQTPSIK